MTVHLMKASKVPQLMCHGKKGAYKVELGTPKDSLETNGFHKGLIGSLISGGGVCSRRVG